MRRRLFLNKPGNQSVAAIFAEVKPKGRDATLKMSDCDHTVTFDVGIYDAEDRANTLYKLDRMVETLAEFRAAIAKVSEKQGDFE